MLTTEIAQEWFVYCPRTGEVRWKKRRSNKAAAGSIAGSVVRPRGKVYRYVRLGADFVYVHRLAFIIQGIDLPDEVDHIDGNSLNNAWENLRATTHSGNQKNMRMNKLNTTGVQGVCKCSKSGKYRAYVTVDGKQRHLGKHATLDQARIAVEDAKKKYGFHENHGKPRI